MTNSELQKRVDNLTNEVSNIKDKAEFNTEKVFEQQKKISKLETKLKDLTDRHEALSELYYVIKSTIHNEQPQHHEFKIGSKVRQKNKKLAYFDKVGTICGINDGEYSVCFQFGTADSVAHLSEKDLELYVEPKHDFQVGDRVQFVFDEENVMGEITNIDDGCATIYQKGTDYKTITYIMPLYKLKPATGEPKCEYKVGDVVVYPSGYAKLPDVGTITKIYNGCDYVEVQNNFDKTLIDVAIKDIKPYTETKCKFNVGDKVKAVRFTAVCDGIGIVTRSPLNIEEEPYIVTFSNGNVMCVFEQDLEPYTEPRWTFTDDEKVILRNLPKEYKWIARDKDKLLYVFFTKPIKKDASVWYCEGKRDWCLLEFNHLFQSIKWTDDQACEFRKYL